MSATALLMSHLLLLLYAFLMCGSAGLLFVRATAPQLAGVGWIGVSFAAGALGTILRISSPDALGGMLPDFTVLLSFVLLHVAVLTLSHSKTLVPRQGSVLLLLEVVTGLCVSRGFGLPHLQTEMLATLVAVQAGQTAVHVLRLRNDANWAPVRFIVTVLCCVAIFGIAQASALLFVRNSDGLLLDMVDAVTFPMYLLAGLGFAFGFFWLSTVHHATHLEEMAGTDPLTRAYNRRNFLQWCEQERERGERNGVSFAVLMVDIDLFKNINDTFGHSVGDTVICDVVDKMRDAIRGIDVVGRWGGEEFAILLRESSIDSALVVAERLRMSIESMDPSAPAIRFGRPRQITVSVGIASHRTSEPIAGLIARADSALYQAKRAGRNCIIACPEDFRASPSEPHDSGQRSNEYTV